MGRRSSTCRACSASERRRTLRRSPAASIMYARAARSPTASCQAGGRDQNCVAGVRVSDRPRTLGRRQDFQTSHYPDHAIVDRFPAAGGWRNSDISTALFSSEKCAATRRAKPVSMSKWPGGVSHGGALQSTMPSADVIKVFAGPKVGDFELAKDNSHHGAPDKVRNNPKTYAALSNRVLRAHQGRGYDNTAVHSASRDIDVIIKRHRLRPAP